MNTSGRVVRWQLEVVDSDPRYAIECLQRYDLGERDIIEDCSKGRYPKFGSRYRPVEAWIVEQESSEFGKARNRGQIMC